MNETDVFSTDTELELAKSLYVWGRFNVANGSAKLDNAGVWNISTTVCRALCNVLNPVLYCIGHMGNDLDCFAEVVSTPFGFNYLGIDFSSCKVVIF